MARMARYAQNHSRRETAAHFKILDPKGQPEKAAVKLLLNGYEPKKAETRRRWGLPEKARQPKPVTPNQLFSLPIQDMPSVILRLALEHRTEMQ